MSGPLKSEAALEAITDASPDTMRLWRDNAPFRSACDVVMASERNGGDPLLAALMMLAEICRHLKAAHDAEVARLMREPAPVIVVAPR